MSSFCQQTEIAEVYRLIGEREVHETLEHENWLKMAEIELFVSARRRLSERVANIELAREHVQAWTEQRNHAHIKIKGDFCSMAQNVVQKILIAENREVIRLGLRSVFEQDNRITDIYEASNFEELKLHMLSYTIDFVIIHQSFLADSKQLPLSGKFILLTHTPDISTLLEAYKRRARGYVSENVTADLLRIALQSQKGSFLLDPLFMPWMMECLSNSLQNIDALSALSPREREIFQLLEGGCDRRSIAKQLHISEATLKTHVKNIARKREKKDVTESDDPKNILCYYPRQTL